MPHLLFVYLLILAFVSASTRASTRSIRSPRRQAAIATADTSVESYTEDDGWNSSASVQYMITNKMRRVLIKNLGYLSEEVDKMDPQIAAVVIDRELNRPRTGMPTSWRRSNTAPQKKPSRRKSDKIASAGSGRKRGVLAGVRSTIRSGFYRARNGLNTAVRNPFVRVAAVLGLVWLNKAALMGALGMTGSKKEEAGRSREAAIVGHAAGVTTPSSDTSNTNNISSNEEHVTDKESAARLSSDAVDSSDPTNSVIDVAGATASTSSTTAAPGASAISLAEMPDIIATASDAAAAAKAVLSDSATVAPAPPATSSVVAARADTGSGTGAESGEPKTALRTPPAESPITSSPPPSSLQQQQLATTTTAIEMKASSPSAAASSAVIPGAAASASQSAEQSTASSSSTRTSTASAAGSAGAGMQMLRGGKSWSFPRIARRSRISLRDSNDDGGGVAAVAVKASNPATVVATAEGSQSSSSSDGRPFERILQNTASAISRSASNTNTKTASIRKLASRQTQPPKIGAITTAMKGSTVKPPAPRMTTTTPPPPSRVHHRTAAAGAAGDHRIDLQALGAAQHSNVFDNLHLQVSVLLSS